MDFDYRRYPRRLNLGCGFDRKQDCLNVDLQSCHHPDLEADCTDLPMLPSGHYQYIIARDILEHIPRARTRKTLWEWNRLLAIHGRIELQVPNVIGLLRLLERSENQSEERHHELLRCLFGTQSYEGDFHYTGFTELTLRGFLERTGFRIQALDILDEWLFHVVAEKISSPPADPLLDIPGDQAFVTEVFRQLLGRDPDPEGFTYYFGLLESGLDRDLVIEKIKASEEYARRVRT